MKPFRTTLSAMFFVAVTLFFASSASAFCGFYVAGSDASLFNDATQVAMVRDGTRTVLSMQNNYRGPAEEFAMVVPVPQVLQEEHVKTLDKAVFDRIDTLTAPRLVEYWEENPCDGWPQVQTKFAQANMSVSNQVSFGGGSGTPDFAVTVEARYSVGEYDIEVLSAEHSSGLYSYLRAKRYNIPDGASEYLQPYIEQGAYFFVARVDPERATFDDGEAVLSPLRFEYDSEQFQLPIRLGMINSGGTQDLIVYLFGNGKRYEVANYPNVFIPTNIEVSSGTRGEFGDFYRALFDRTVAANPGAVVTEYAWGAGKCDPCPGPVLDLSELSTLGVPGRWTVTRLHARYEPNDIGEDLVFRTADAVTGGVPNVRHQDVEPAGNGWSTQNSFQGRYIIRHHWTGPITCTNPEFGKWGGKPMFGDSRVSSLLSPNSGGSSGEGGELEDYIREPVMAFGIVGSDPWWASRSLRTRWGMLLTALIFGLAFVACRRLWRTRRFPGVMAFFVGGVLAASQPELLTLFGFAWFVILLESFVLWAHRIDVT